MCTVRLIKGLMCVHVCVCVCSGCTDRKGEGGLQHLRRLHSSGGCLFGWEALRWERWGQQVRYTHTHTPKCHLLQPAGATVSQLEVNREVFVSAPHPKSYRHPGQGSHPHVSRVHTGVRETATTIPGKKK